MYYAAVAEGARALLLWYEGSSLGSWAPPRISPSIDLAIPVSVISPDLGDVIVRRIDTALEAREYGGVTIRAILVRGCVGSSVPVLPGQGYWIM